MEKSIDKRIEDTAKLQAEIARSLSVVEMKKVHCQIEEVEKNRKKPAILSIIERIDFTRRLCASVEKHVSALRKKDKVFFNSPFPEYYDVKKSPMEVVIESFESLRLDLKRNIDIREEDFEKLFPNIIQDFKTPNDILYCLNSMQVKLTDMKNYCKRLI